MSPSEKDRLNSQLEEFRRRVRELPPGGDLDGLLLECTSELRALFYEEMLAERENLAADEADFPPSELPGVSPSPSVQPGDETPEDSDAER